MQEVEQPRRLGGRREAAPAWQAGIERDSREYHPPLGPALVHVEAELDVRAVEHLELREADAAGLVGAPGDPRSRRRDLDDNVVTPFVASRFADRDDVDAQRDLLASRASVNTADQQR